MLSVCDLVNRVMTAAPESTEIILLFRKVSLHIFLMCMCIVKFNALIKRRPHAHKVVYILQYSPFSYSCILLEV